MKIIDIIKNGILKENPIFVQAIGMCPTLAVTTSIENGFGMGVATLAVIMCSNVAISLMRNVVPEKVRIPAYVIIIAGFASIVQVLLEAYFPDLNKSLGIYIPLIVVNCLLLARAESFASKNSPFKALCDAMGMGLGFTVALTILGAIREMVGAGTVLGMTVLPESFPKTVIMILPPGAFITLGCLMALLNFFNARKKDTKEKKVPHTIL